MDMIILAMVVASYMASSSVAADKPLYGADWGGFGLSVTNTSQLGQLGQLGRGGWQVAIGSIVNQSIN